MASFILCLHPLLMVIGFILISGEAILVHRWLPGSRKIKKWVHLWLQGLALASGIFGIWTKFQGRDGVVANFYSFGYPLCFFVWSSVVDGFPKLLAQRRGTNDQSTGFTLACFSWSLYIWISGSNSRNRASREVTFLQTNGIVCNESMIVNGLVLGLAMLCGLVMLTAFSPKQYQRIPTTKVVYSDSKCLTS